MAGLWMGEARDKLRGVDTRDGGKEVSGSSLLKFV